jgi:hypothetical protein
LRIELGLAVVGVEEMIGGIGRMRVVGKELTKFILSQLLKERGGY